MISLVICSQKLEEKRGQEVDGNKEDFEQNGLYERPEDLSAHDFDGILVVDELDVEEFGVFEVVAECPDVTEGVYGLEGEMGESLEVNLG